MQIEWREGLTSRCAGTVPRSTADHAAHSEAGLCEKCCKASSEETGRRDLSGDRANNDGPWRSTQSFLMRRVVSCGSGDLRWRTKLYLGSRESLYDHHRGSALGAEPKITGVLGRLVCLALSVVPSRATESKEVRKWNAAGWPGNRSFGCARSCPEVGATGKRRRNSSSERVITRCSFLWAESRQRKVTLRSTKETSRWLEMATRWGVTAQIAEYMLWASERSF